MSASQKHRHVFGQTLRMLRQQSGLSQEALAEKADLSAVFISRVERGKESPSLDSIVKISKAFGIRVRVLVADI